MYNLYLYEKQKSLEEEEEKNKKKLLKYQRKHKKEINDLSEKYDKRMENFVLNLCKNPVIINCSEEAKNVFRDTKSYNKLKTLKPKLKKIDNDKLNVLQKNKSENLTIIGTKPKEKIFVQPKMKFGCSSDLENIIDMVNKMGTDEGNKKKYNKILKYFRKITKNKGFYQIKSQSRNLNNSQNNMSMRSNVFSQNEDSDNDNEYSYKNTIALKFKGNCIPIVNKNNDDVNNNFLNSNSLCKNKKILYQYNKIKRLFNDNRKLYFKGASQNISLKELKKEKSRHCHSVDSIKNISVIYTDKKIYLKKINKKERNNGKDENDKTKKEEEKYKIDNARSNNIFDEYDDKVTGLSEYGKFKRKKMNELMNKEIKKSIINNFIDKYDIISEYNKNNKINEKCLIFHKHQKLYEKEDDDLNDKLKYLLKISQKKNKTVNNTKNNPYENFVNYFKAKIKESLSKKNNFIDANFTNDENNTDYVLIDGHFISKKNFKSLSEAIFTKCNFYKKKSKCNQTSLVKDEVKLQNKIGLKEADFKAKPQM